MTTAAPVTAAGAITGAQLVLVADAAYPFDYGLLPPACRVVLGYVGGVNMTPHIWSVDEVAACRRAGRLWYPIYTVPMRRLNAFDGTQAAANMLPALGRHGIGPSEPKFLDIEYSAYAADPAGALACADAWKFGLQSAGHGNGHAYLPLAAGRDWVAHWTHVRPSTLPAGVVGIQYDNALANDAYDLSVFDPRIFPHLGDTMSLDDATLGQIRTVVKEELAGLFGRIHGDVAGTEMREVTDLADAELAKVSLAGISGQLTRLQQSLGGPGGLAGQTVQASITFGDHVNGTAAPSGE